MRRNTPIGLRSNVVRPAVGKVVIELMDGAQMNDWHRWELPLSEGMIGYLSLPRRNLTEAEWKLMMKYLRLVKKALVQEPVTVKHYTKLA